MDIHEYRKFLHKIFPSKDLKNKIISGEKVKKLATKSKSKAVEEEEEAQDYLEYSDLNYLEESLLYDNY